MKVLSTEQMRALDRHCIHNLGIPGLLLMERAGAAIARAALEMTTGTSGTVLVLCGKGNNGGDGLVAARLLREDGINTSTLLPFSADELSADARVMLERAKVNGVYVTDTVTNEQLAEAEVVIDALLGTGITGAAHGLLGELIERVNTLRNGRGVLAVDLPSGVAADTGQTPGPAIQAEITITLALPKPGLLLYPGARHAGAWQTADIGFPPEVVAGWPAVGEITERTQAANWLPTRLPTAHKYSVGAAMIIAGSFGMTGAAAMAATAAYRSGAGLVRLALPAPLVSTLNTALTEVVFLPLPAVGAGMLGYRAIAPILRAASDVKATLLGPGLSRLGATMNAVRRLLPHVPGPLVVDADALTAMAGHDELWQQRTAPTIITPHAGEMARLLNRTVRELEADRLETASEAAQRYNAVTVFKGAPTIIAAPDGKLFINPTGNAGLAVAGSGDVLAGMIVSLLAQGCAPLQAATLAVYLGGLAADRLATRMGIHGMTAPDLIEELPYAISSLINEL